MLTIEPGGGPELRYHVSGHLSANDLKAYYAELDRRYAAYGALRLLVRVTDFRGYRNGRALIVFLTHEYRLLRQVDRYAMVTDQRMFYPLLSALDKFPGPEARAFAPEDAAAAEAWLRR